MTETGIKKRGGTKFPSEHIFFAICFGITEKIL